MAKAIGSRCHQAVQRFAKTHQQEHELTLMQEQG